MLGELGSLVAEKKKQLRDGDAYTGSQQNLAEELGDMFWYVARSATLAGIDLSEASRKAPCIGEGAELANEQYFLLSRYVQQLVELVRSSADR